MGASHSGCLDSLGFQRSISCLRPEIEQIRDKKQASLRINQNKNNNSLRINRCFVFHSINYKYLEKPWPARILYWCFNQHLNYYNIYTLNNKRIQGHCRAHSSLTCSQGCFNAAATEILLSWSTLSKLSIRSFAAKSRLTHILGCLKTNLLLVMHVQTSKLNIVSLTTD